LIKVLILVFLFLYTTELFSADVNASIVEGERGFYKTLLKTISKNSASQSEVNLEKTLLQKLMQEESKCDLKVDLSQYVDTQEAYRKLFLSYISNLETLKNLQKKIEANQAKRDTLLEQIHAQQKALLTTQLFYAFYLKKEKEERAQLQTIEKNLIDIQNVLIDSLKKITFDEKKISKHLQMIDSSLADLDSSIEQLKIKKERYFLLEKTSLIEAVKDKIAKKFQQKQKLYKQKLSYLFLKFTLEIQEHSDKIMMTHQTIILLVKEDIDKGYLIAKDVESLLLTIEQELLGSIETFKEQGMQELQRELETFLQIIQKPLFVINKTPISTLKLLLSLVIFIVGFFIGTLYKKYIAKLANKNKSISTGSHILLANMGYYTIFLITFFIVLKVLGIDLSSIALVAGALSVGIGFGLQNVISNFVSGIILMVERSVKIGDYIELDNDLRGHVVDIKMRSITVNTNSNIDIIVPNQDLIQNRVINWTMNDKIRRFEIPFGVAYGTQPQKVISIILEAVQTSAFQDLYNTPEKHTRVIMTGMGNSSVDFELFVWIKGKEILFPKRTTSRFLVLIYNTLYEHGIEIPFPQQDLHIRSSDIDLPIILKKDEND